MCLDVRVVIGLNSYLATNNAVRTALSTSLTRILTPKTSTDLLLSIRTKLTSPLTSSQQRIPYSIVFVGVNGVGKSTNLSKVCFWLIQNNLRVLIAACDTFRRVYTPIRIPLFPVLIMVICRSGAVEQLRVHVRNLSMLGVDGANSKGRVELYEKGYGKDAAGIAKEAIAHGLFLQQGCHTELTPQHSERQRFRCRTHRYGWSYAGQRGMAVIHRCFPCFGTHSNTHIATDEGAGQGNYNYLSDTHAMTRVDNILARLRQQPRQDPLCWRSLGR